MKSKIKIDVDYCNQPVIEIVYDDNNEDLRDKMLGRFLNELYPRGRLAFIDRDGNKLNTNTGGNPFRYTIKTINPDHYEFILEEVQKLIEERDSDRSLQLICEKKEELKKITESYKKVILNY